MPLLQLATIYSANFSPSDPPPLPYRPSPSIFREAADERRQTATSIIVASYRHTHITTKHQSYLVITMTSSNFSVVQVVIV